MKRTSVIKQFAGTIAITALSGLLFACASATDPDIISSGTEGNTAGTVSGEEASADNIILVSTEDTDSSYEEADTVTVRLQDNTAVCSSSSVSADNGTVTVSSAGTYVISGTLSDGQIVVDAGKEDDEDTNIVEDYQAKQGNTDVTSLSGQKQKQGTVKTEATTPTEPADQQSGGLNIELLMYVGGGALFIMKFSMVDTALVVHY